MVLKFVINIVNYKVDNFFIIIGCNVVSFINSLWLVVIFLSLRIEILFN